MSSQACQIPCSMLGKSIGQPWLDGTYLAVYNARRSLGEDLDGGLDRPLEAMDPES